MCLCIACLAVSGIISILLALVRMGLIASVQGWESLERWSIVGWSKMERHEQPVWRISGEHVPAQEDFSLMALCISYPLITAHSEGRLGMGIGALVESCSMHLLLDGFHGWLCLVRISTCLIRDCMGGFCEQRLLAGNALRNTYRPPYILFTTMQ